MADPNDTHRSFCRVLVIDDEGGLQLLVRGVLESNDYMVDVASDGLEGCDKVEQAEYDVIVCDVSMPRMDGLTFYDELRQIDEGQANRLLFVTGATLGSERSDRIEATGRPVLRKPFELEEFMEAVDRMRRGGVGE